ncbi:hypothetical protein EVAR_102686_1 [Eumeta japonica]|uniref:Uncharacterized protein n=1 Tax=Eumeta variegata TaxID=151549 RepID=A0A4C1TIU1_EUMVA|nr:hypothetical protein EVAR_102686_1 [Eumeta japonica]
MNAPRRACFKFFYHVTAPFYPNCSRACVKLCAAVHADASLTQAGERQMSNAAERGGRLCLFVARSTLSLAFQALRLRASQSKTTLDRHGRPVEAVQVEGRLLERWFFGDHLSRNRRTSRKINIGRPAFE